MTLRFLLLLLALTAGAVAAFTLKDETGYSLVSFHGYSLETSLLGLICLVAVFFLAIYYSLQLLRTLIALPERSRQHHLRRRKEAAQLNFELGLSKLFEGHWKRAEVELVRRAADHHAPHLNYLAAARAAQRVGAPERRDQYLQLAQSHAPKLSLMLTLTQAELQRERGEWAAVKASCQKLRELDPQHAYALELLIEACNALGQPAEVRQLLALPLAAKALTPLHLAKLANSSSISLLQEAAQRADLGQLKAVWAATPNPDAPQVARVYAAALAQVNADSAARNFIEQWLGLHYDDQLVHTYGQLHTADPIAQLASLERWLQVHGEQPALLQAAGTACINNHLWGKAESYLQAVITRAPSAAAYLALAQLAEQTQQPQAAAGYYRQGLQFAANAPLEPSSGA